MAQSASAASSVGQQHTGGTISENSPGVIVAIVAAIVLIVFIYLRKK